MSGCKGYYSYDAGAWHVAVLNSECSVGGDSCVVSEMQQWLRDDLAANTAACTLAYWHKPVLTIGPHANDEGGMLPVWQILYDAGAELVLSGHDHSYQRYNTLNRNANGADSSLGIRQFVAGTGGRPLTTATRTGTTPGLQVWQDASTANKFGVLKLTLHASTYDWEFVPVSAGFTDSGSGSCHGAPSTPTPSTRLRPTRHSHTDGYPHADTDGHSDAYADTNGHSDTHANSAVTLRSPAIGRWTLAAPRRSPTLRASRTMVRCSTRRGG